MDAFHLMESVFELTLDGLDFLFKRVIDTWHLGRHHLGQRHLASHLLLVILDESRLHHVDSVLSLNFFTIVQQESLITCQLLLDRLDGNFVDGLADTEGIHSGEQLFSDV